MPLPPESRTDTERRSLRASGWTEGRTSVSRSLKEVVVERKVAIEVNKCT